MNLRDIAKKIGGYITNKTRDNEGWIRQGKLTPSNVWETGVGKGLVKAQEITQDPQLGQKAGDWFRNVGNTQAPAFKSPVMQNVVKGVSNYAGNIVQPFIAGAQQAGTALSNLTSTPNLDRNLPQKAHNVIKLATGVARTSLPTNPLYTGTSALSSLPQMGQKDPIRRLSAGITKGMSGQNVSTNVPEIKTKLGPLGEVDLVQGVGQLVGYAKQPLWDKLNPALSVINKGEILKNPIANYLVTRYAKGGIEGIIQGFADMPDNISDKEKAKFMLNSILVNSAGEIVMDKTGEMVGKGFKRVFYGPEIEKLTPEVMGHLAKTYKQFRDAAGRYAKRFYNYPGVSESEAQILKRIDNTRIGGLTKEDMDLAKQLGSKVDWENRLQFGQGTRNVGNVERIVKSTKGVGGEGVKFSKVDEYKNPSGKLLMERFESKQPDGSSLIIEKTNTGFHTFKNNNRIDSSGNIPISQKPLKTFEEAKQSLSPSKGVGTGFDVNAERQKILTQIENTKNMTAMTRSVELPKLQRKLEMLGGMGAKTASVNQTALPKTPKLPEIQSPNKTNLLEPQTQGVIKTSQYPSPNINTNRLNVTKKVKTFVDKTVEEVKPQIEKTVGRKLSNKEAIKLADNSAKVLNRAISRDETLAWEAKMLKARQLLAKQATEGKVTQEYIDNLIAVKSQGTDIARKLQSLSVGADAKEVTAKQAILEAVMKVTDDTDLILKKAKGVNFNDYEQSASFYREFVKPKVGDWLEKIRYSSMLSSPNTHINNFSSNVQGTGIIAPVEKTISGSVDKLLSIFNPSRKRQQFSGEGVAYAKGYYSNVGNAWKNFKDTFTGAKLSSAQEMYNLPLSSKGAATRGVENVLSFPSKVLQAADEFFTTLTSGGVESQLKYRQSRGLKVNGIEEKAYLEARKRLFNAEFGLKEEGPLLKALEYIPMKVAEARASDNPVLSTVARYTFPFVRVPSNIFKASVEYSPLGVSTIGGASNKVEQLSKALLGTGIGLSVASVVAGDDMTWAEPTDANKRNAFRAAGMQPYSIRVGDKWYSYSKIHPAISFNLALVAAIRDAEKNKTLDDTQIDTLLDGVSKWVNFYADMSYVKNLSDATSGVKGDLSAGTRQVSNYVQQLVPFRALMGWVARMVDPVQREVDKDGSILTKQLQQLSTQIPLVSQSVPARLDSKGQPIENQNRFINSFSPVRVTNVVPQAETTYKSMVTKSINTKNENIVKERVLKTGQEEVYNGKKYYPSFETNSKTGEKTPVIKSIKVPQTTSEVYKNLSKKYESSPDSPQNILQKVATYGTAIFKDPEGTIKAIKSGEPIRKVNGDSVVVERLKNLASIDQGDKSTEVDHVIAISLGGSNDESNLQVISKQDNRAKGIVDTYLSELLKAGKITKKEAQLRDLNWRQELDKLPADKKAVATKILSATPTVTVTKKTNSGILNDLATREFEPVKNEETQTYSNVEIKLPEAPRLTGLAEVDKALKSKYSSQISSVKTNLGKLYVAEKITAQEYNDALVSLNNSKLKVNSGTKSKGGKITIKETKVSIPKINIKFRSPTASTIKLKSAPKIKIGSSSSSNNRRYTIKA